MAWRQKRWRCDCPGREGKAEVCCHISAVGLMLRLPHTLLVNLNPDEFGCPRCGAGLDEAEESGVQRNKSGNVQRFQCHRCGYRFNERGSFEGLKSSPAVVLAAVDLFFRGLSAHESACHIEVTYGVKVDPSTVYRWTIRYCKLLLEVEKQILPALKKLGLTWHGDEVVVKLNGRLAYLWDIMDHHSRYALALSLQTRRDSATFKRVIDDVVNRLGRKPKSFTSDGLLSYQKGLPKPGIKHISGRRFSASWNNNRLERFNKSVRRRTKVSEKFTDEESGRLLMDGGYRSFYNLIRPHMALGGKTPAEKAGLKFRSQNHLLELVKKGRPQRSR